MAMHTGTPDTEDVPTGDELRPIGAVAQELDLTPRAIRYYEELGLLRPAVRVKGANRLYDAGDVERLRRIKQLREVVGFSLAEIADLLDTEDMRAQLTSEFQGATERYVRARVIRDAIALAEKRLRLIEGKLSQLAEMRDAERERLTKLAVRLEQEEDDDDGET
ncbi:MAG TPA: MerR family transcriptional regulator [Thermomicrobiaceae bacterium]|nr:MerR family transcriptional regulator [Thermomicrobiaceae bacterium]